MFRMILAATVAAFVLAFASTARAEDDAWKNDPLVKRIDKMEERIAALEKKLGMANPATMLTSASPPASAGNPSPDCTCTNCTCGMAAGSNPLGIFQPGAAVANVAAAPVRFLFNGRERRQERRSRRHGGESSCSAGTSFEGGGYQSMSFPMPTAGPGPTVSTSAGGRWVCDGNSCRWVP